ncbi:MAG: SRPBCC domain-containing protein [Phycisphaerales bacterium]|nr:SRPBCC domain-containing protein [Phycisphaerales bacterium]
MPSEIRKERVYQYPPEVVWVALTDPRAIAEWLMPNTFKAEVGHKFKFMTDPHMFCSDAGTDCEVLELEPPRRMVWSWRMTDKKGCQYPPLRITWELEPTGAGATRLRFTQSGMTGQKRIAMFMMNMGWGYMVKRLIPKVLANCQADGGFAPGAIPLEKRCYKVKTVPEEFVR